MKTTKLQRWVLSYKTKCANKRIVYAVKICKYPERTKHYKKLKNFLDSGLIENIGYCDMPYYEDYESNFINWLTPGNSIYIQNKINKLLTTK